MQVTLIASNLAEKTWMLPKALLAHHAGYFRRTERFREGEQNKITLESFQPEIFELIVEFVYFGRYSNIDKLEDTARIRDSARAWVLGDCLDAVAFKNFAMKSLHNIYFPAHTKIPKLTVGPKLIDYCCAMTTGNSKLYQFFIAVLVGYWHDNDIICYSHKEREQWDAIWDEHRDVRSDVLFYTNQKPSIRKESYRGLDHYLERIPSEKLLAFDS
jgi:hypothetical protein